MKKIILYISILFLFTGCSMAKYKDVSHEKEYFKVIGKTYKTLIPLRIHANLTDDYKSKKILSYSISLPPGSGGRYVLWNKKLKVGTYIKINKVMSSMNWLTSRDKFVVQVLSEKLDKGIPVNLYRHSLTIMSDNKYLVMDPKIFQEQ